MNLSVVILAAGKGKRMRSSRPKALQRMAGIPLLEHVVLASQKIKPNKIHVVYGNESEEAVKELSHLSSIHWVKQKEQLGTGHAVKQVLPYLDEDEIVLVLYGDVPLIASKTLEHLLERTPKDAVGWLTAHVENPHGFGRILRDEDGNPKAIIEERDATKSQKAIDEINTGICLVPVRYFKKWLPTLKNDNAQNEYYLTDIFMMALERGINITTVSPETTTEIIGVNDKIQLAYLERLFQKKSSEEHMKNGLMLLDPNRFDVRGNLSFGKDVCVDVNVIIEGSVSLGARCKIGSNVLLRNVEIGDDVEIKANSVIEEAVISKGCVIGPFARIRPDTVLGEKAKVGNFVEIKNSKIGKGSKVSHLSYIGDTTMGKNINVGAGTICCNYDGVKKHQTIIDDDAFIGSGTQLVAPVKIGAHATIGAGSTITEDAPKNKLTLARTKQITIDHWESPRTKKK